ncbi:MAG: hypothetical protein ACC652_15360, partial [Acidimicrobiales bacterium]
MSRASALKDRLDRVVSPMSSRKLAVMVMMSSTTGRFRLDAYIRFCTIVFEDEIAATRQVDSLLAAGDLVLTDDGIVSLGPSLNHLTSMRDRLMQSVAAHWDGEFSVFVADGRVKDADYEMIHQTLKRSRYGLLQQGCWMRPSNVDSPFDDDTASQPAGLHAMRARIPHPRSLVSRLWDLDGWNDRAETVIELEKDSMQLLEVEGRDAIGLSCLVLAAASGLAAGDPLLPAALVPPGWLGTTAHNGLFRLDQLTREMLAQHLQIE